jgi:transcription antitermination factor NusA-like protein
MVNILDMKDIMYLNLFSKITRLNTRYCFMYNDVVIFAVPKNMVSKAVGENGRNVKKINEVLRKKIKIIPIPMGIQHAKEFIHAVVEPTGFKDLEITDKEIIINAGSQNKAALIGRNKRRFLELQLIVKDFFKKELKII